LVRANTLGGSVAPHFLDSDASAAPLFRTRTRRIVDLGSGGDLPGGMEILGGCRGRMVESEPPQMRSLCAKAARIANARSRPRFRIGTVRHRRDVVPRAPLPPSTTSPLARRFIRAEKTVCCSSKASTSRKNDRARPNWRMSAVRLPAAPTRGGGSSLAESKSPGEPQGGVCAARRSRGRRARIHRDARTNGRRRQDHDGGNLATAFAEDGRRVRYRSRRRQCQHRARLCRGSAAG